MPLRWLKAVLCPAEPDTTTCVSKMRINLNCPYDQKDEAKALGARWDPGLKVWYIEDVADLKPFSKWIPLMGRMSAGMLQKKKENHKPKTTGSYIPMCNCEALPWEDCEHTELETQIVMSGMYGMDGFVF